MSLFLDFDGTITAKDTIGELAKFALRVRAEQGDDLDQEWDEVVKAYMSDCGENNGEYHLQEEERRLPEQEVEFLRQMKTIELRSLERVRECRIFKGISEDTFRQAGRDAVARGIVSLRPGFHKLVEARLQENWKVFVISVNWSSAFIEGACDHAGIKVIANDVQPDGSIVGPGILNGSGDEPRALTNSHDKLVVMQRILEAESLQSKTSFYFGDSVTDLECLLAAKHGVVIADKEDSKLIQALRRIGGKVSHVNTKDFPQALLWASNYEEVMQNITFKGK